MINFDRFVHILIATVFLKYGQFKIEHRTGWQFHKDYSMPEIQLGKKLSIQIIYFTLWDLEGV